MVCVYTYINVHVCVSTSFTHRSRRHTVFAGDDTWGLLFPGAFSSMYLFPSFNVWDLHTVDNGVLSVLFPMLNLSLPRNAVDCYNPPCAILPPSLRGVRLNQSSDMIQEPVRAGVDESWRLFVGHFLGVDHVGHHLNANAPEMTVKLRQVDAILAAIIPALPNDTLLVVMGDHGVYPSLVVTVLCMWAAHVPSYL